MWIDKVEPLLRIPHEECEAASPIWRCCLLFALDGRHLNLVKYVWYLRYYLMSMTHHTFFSPLLVTLGVVGASVKIGVQSEEIWQLANALLTAFVTIPATTGANGAGSPKCATMNPTIAPAIALP
jgi:hypothetical protein